MYAGCVYGAVRGLRIDSRATVRLRIRCGENGIFQEKTEGRPAGKYMVDFVSGLWCKELAAVTGSVCLFFCGKTEGGG